MRASIIHVPKGLSDDDWTHNYINFMPMGTYSVANFALARGHSVTVLNSAVFGNRDTALEQIFRNIEVHDSQVVGMPLHWHFSGADVLYVAEAIKRRCPGVKVVLGGITASVLGEELMRHTSALDAIVHGDGEEPFARYLSELDRGEQCELTSVPNLRWRQGQDIIFNGISYVASREQYSSFDYGISKTVEDLRQYPNGITMVDAVAGRTKDLQAEKVEEKIFFVNLGRGCSYNCVYCAGCRQSFKTHFGRKEPMARSPESVLRTMRDAYMLGFRRFHFCWDCAFKAKEQHMQELLRGVRRDIGDDLTLIYEAYHAPSRPFLELCCQSFAHVNMILSPCFYEYDVMRRFMGYSYTLNDLAHGVEEMRRQPNCTPFIYFAVTPLEDWSEAGLSQKTDTMVRLKNQLGCKVSAMPIYAEPGSPWVTFPEIFGSHTFPLSFRDFLEEWRKPLTPWSERLSGVKDVNRVMAQIDHNMGIDKLNEL